MIKIMYFVTPSGLVKVGAKAIEFIPMIGPSLTFTKKAKKFTQISNPVSAGSKGIGLIFNYCFGKTAALSVECFLYIVFVFGGGITGNPVLIAAGAECGNLILDELFD